MRKEYDLSNGVRGKYAGRHSCDAALTLEALNNPRLDAGRAQDGDEWKCNCGRIYVHICDEAEGCRWEGK